MGITGPRRLTACPLDDAGLSTGEDAWQDLPDPFAGTRTDFRLLELLIRQ